MTPVDRSSLIVNHLVAGHGRIQVVHDVRLRVGRGELVAVLGRNGAGKTTALQTIAGAGQGPRGGEVTLDGRDITRLRPHEVVRLGLKLVSEGRRVFPTMTVADNLQLGGFTQRRRHTLAADLGEVLTLFPALGSRLRTKVGQLSGGQQQMVAIGQALMARPSLLLLDEPCAGLAPVLVEQMYDAFRTLVTERNLGVLVVEQDIERALALSDRFYVIDAGRTVLDGPCEPGALPAISAAVIGAG